MLACALHFSQYFEFVGSKDLSLWVFQIRKRKNPMIKSKLFYLLVLLVGISACKKDVDELLWEDASSTEMQSQLGVSSVFEAMQDGPETFAVNASNAIEVWTSDNVGVLIPENSILDADGNLVEGEVDLDVLFVLTKSDMIRYQATTMTSDGKFLESGGEIFVRAYKDGAPLDFDSSKVFSIRVPNNNPQSDMDYFVGERDENNNVSWELGTPDLAPNWGNPTGSEWQSSDGTSFGYGYELLCDRFGWQNIDKFLENFGEPVSDNRITVTLPEGFGNLNTAGYCILDDYESVIGLFVDVASEEMYIEGVPVGANVTIFIVSLQDVAGVETSYAEVISVVVEADHQITLTSLTERTSAEIEALLDAI